MDKHAIVFEKKPSSYGMIISNLEKVYPSYPSNLAYDTDKDLEDYYICNFGHNPRSWPSHGGYN